MRRLRTRFSSAPSSSAASSPNPLQSSIKEAGAPVLVRLALGALIAPASLKDHSKPVSWKSGPSPPKQELTIGRYFGAKGLGHGES